MSSLQQTVFGQWIIPILMAGYYAFLQLRRSPGVQDFNGKGRSNGGLTKQILVVS